MSSVDLPLQERCKNNRKELCDNYSWHFYC